MRSGRICSHSRRISFGGHWLARSMLIFAATGLGKTGCGGDAWAHQSDARRTSGADPRAARRGWADQVAEGESIRIGVVVP